MDTRPVLEFARSLSTLQAWPDMQAILQRAAAQPRDWVLPAAGARAVGGSTGSALPAMAAVACCQISIVLIDDLLDADPRGEHQRLGMPAVANLAAAFQAAGMEAIASSEAPPGVRLSALERLNRMISAVALGQHWDMQNPADEAAYWRVVQAKSAAFFGAALGLGALFGGAAPGVAQSLEWIGQLYGEMIQIHDDLGDCLAVPANPDWAQGRAPLPILFAQVVDHPERERFLELRRAVAAPPALEEAQAILIRCGAISYGLDQLLRRHDAARRALSTLPLTAPEAIGDLLEAVIQPVDEVLETAGSL